MELSAVLRSFVLLGILATAAVTDAAENKVYNVLTGAGAICELVVYAAFPYAAEPEALIYECSFLAVLMMFFCMRKIGGADVKLYLLTVFAYPNSSGLDIIVYSVLAAGSYGVLVCAADLLAVRQTVSDPRVVSAASSGPDGAVSDAAKERRIRSRMPRRGIAMGVFIFLGAVIRLIVQHGII